jgi:hypothetical protein
MRMVICFQIPTTLYICGTITSLSLTVQNVSDVRQIKIHTAKLLVHDPNPFEVEVIIAKLKKYKLPSSDQNPQK